MAVWSVSVPNGTLQECYQIGSTFLCNSSEVLNALRKSFPGIAMDVWCENVEGTFPNISPRWWIVLYDRPAHFVVPETLKMSFESARFGTHPTSARTSERPNGREDYVLLRGCAVAPPRVTYQPFRLTAVPASIPRSTLRAHLHRLLLLPLRPGALQIAEICHPLRPTVVPASILSSTLQAHLRLLLLPSPLAVLQPASMCQPLRRTALPAAILRSGSSAHLLGWLTAVHLTLLQVAVTC